MPIATINGYQMAYEVTGGGPPVVFVHGGFGGIEGRIEPVRPWWVDELFARRFTVVTYDRRGCGRSEIPEGGYDVETFAGDLHGLIETLGVAPAYVIGSSAGGPIAIRHALTYPEEVKGLVLINTSPSPLGGEGSAALRQMLARRRALGPDAVPDAQAGADPADAAAARRLREQVAALAPEERRRAFDAWQRTVEAYEELDLTPRLSSLAMPVYVIHGRQDELIPAAAAYLMSNRIPHATTRVLGGQGHGLATRRDSDAPQFVLEWLLAREGVSG